MEAIERNLTASLSSSTAAFIAMVLSEIVFPENELAHSCIGPKMRSMLPFFSIALLRVAQSQELEEKKEREATRTEEGRRRRGRRGEGGSPGRE